MAPSYYLSLVRLQHITSLKPFDLIIKGKKYIKHGQTAPKGVVTHRGPHGGVFYFVEDKHLKNQGKEHELIRSRGVTKDQFKTIEEKYKSQGAESVHFVHVPGLEKNQKGENLYNIYVNWGETTQKKISDKKMADKARYGHPSRQAPEKPWVAWEYDTESVARQVARELQTQGKEVRLSSSWENGKKPKMILEHRTKEQSENTRSNSSRTSNENQNRNILPERINPAKKSPEKKPVLKEVKPKSKDKSFKKISDHTIVNSRDTEESLKKKTQKQQTPKFVKDQNGDLTYTVKEGAMGSGAYRIQIDKIEDDCHRYRLEFRSQDGDITLLSQKFAYNTSDKTRILKDIKQTVSDTINGKWPSHYGDIRDKLPFSIKKIIGIVRLGSWADNKYDKISAEINKMSPEEIEQYRDNYYRGFYDLDPDLLKT